VRSGEVAPWHRDLTSEVSLTARDPEVAVLKEDVHTVAAVVGRGEPVPSPAVESASEQLRWRELLAPYARPDRWRSTLDVATSVLPYLVLWAVMYFTVRNGDPYVLTLLLSVVAAGFLVRSYIVFHDCAHGSFLASKRANAWLGTSVGLLVFQTFACWRHNHAVHHATAGDLSRRGVGDVITLTVAEYQARSRGQRLIYRLFRHPLIMFGVGPIFALVVQPRIVPRTARPRIKRRVVATDVALAIWIAGLCLLLGWQDYLLVQAPIVMLAGAAGIWLFYVQHQFDDVYWERGEQWSYVDAALLGSAYLKLPKVLQFFSGNIGLHHVHHLSSRIPNYNLQRAHDDIPMFHQVPTLSLIDGLRAVRLKLYDEEQRRMVTFAQVG
jgi:acyl-lipid omega-6 desaturase (Delta-12 desaturase)